MRVLLLPYVEPFVDMVTGGVSVPGAIPDRLSEAENITTTGVLFQPLAFGAGDGLPVIVGAVLSMFRVTVALAVLPALSTAVPATTWLAPSAETAIG